MHRGFYAHVDENRMSIRFKSNHKVMMTCYPMYISDTLHWLKCRILHEKLEIQRGLVPLNAQIPKMLIANKTIDYDIWHRCFGHPSKDIL